MNYLVEIGRRGSLALWLLAAAVSLALLFAVLWQVDWAAVSEMTRTASLPAVGVAFLCMTVAGLLTASRIQLFTPNRPDFATCLKVTAHYSVLLVLLPARLGEVGAVLLFRRYFRQRAGAAILSVITQRLFDLAVVGAIFLLSGVMVLRLSTAIEAYALAALLVTLLPLGLFYLDRPLGGLARFLLRETRPKTRLRTRFVRLLLQARIWHRHGLSRRTLVYGIGLTAARWVFNLTGMALLFHALHLGLAPEASLWAATAYNLLAVIPVQTIGGIGVSEAGLAGLLVLLGKPLALAAGASILIRVALVLTPFLFWLLVLAALQIGNRASMR